MKILFEIQVPSGNISKTIYVVQGEGGKTFPVGESQIKEAGVEEALVEFLGREHDESPFWVYDEGQSGGPSSMLRIGSGVDLLNPWCEL